MWEALETLEIVEFMARETIEKMDIAMEKYAEATLHYINEHKKTQDALNKVINRVTHEQNKIQKALDQIAADLQEEEESTEDYTYDPVFHLQMNSSNTNDT